MCDQNTDFTLIDKKKILYLCTKNGCGPQKLADLARSLPYANSCGNDLILMNIFSKSLRQNLFLIRQ
jgi:hypothetical protein